MSVYIASKPEEGFAGHAYRIGGSIQATPAEVRRGMEQSMVAILRRVKSHAPVGTRSLDARGRSASRGGTLRQKLHYTIPDWNVGTITGGTVYTRIQDIGGKTKAHDIAPRFAKMLAWPASAGSPFVNAMRFGGGATRGMSSRNVSSAIARTRSGRAVTGLFFFWASRKGRVVKHPGSRIKAQNFSYRGFQEALPTVVKVMENVGRDIMAGKR